jgi:hypothetical protein
MKKSTLIVAAIWIYVIGAGVVQGYLLPTSLIVQDVHLPWPFFVAMPFIIVVGAMFRNTIPGEFSVGHRVDQWFGKEIYKDFMKSLRLELLFAATLFATGLVGYCRALQLGEPGGAYSICCFFISAGVAFLIAYFIGIRRVG